MRIAGIYDESMSNGDGWRGVVFVSGCPHNCKGCHNKEAQNYYYGEEYDLDELASRFTENSILSGVTISGGEPLCPENIGEVISLIKKIKSLRSDFNIWCYTGYRIEYLRDTSYYQDILECVDVLVDGPFIEELHDPSLRFRGSSNQRIIDL